MESDDIWTRKPFRQCVLYLEEIDRVLRLSTLGITQVSKFVPLAEAVAGLGDLFEAEGISGSDVDLDRVRKDAELSEVEIHNDFPLLHAHALVSMWSALETVIEDFLVAWFINEPDVLREPALARINIPLAEFEIMDKDARMRFLLRRLQESLKIDNKSGVGGFEVLLGAFGLSGPVDDEVKLRLYQLNHIRHVIVHRSSFVDERFVRACPMLGYKPGDRIMINHVRYIQYFEAIQRYLVEVMRRITQYAKDRAALRVQPHAETLE